MPRKQPALSDDPTWYKDAIIYELHVKAFCDSNGDGMGDFTGLMSKLDYLENLGVTALWLLPFYPSPLRDDGYDIADYYNVHPAYGTLQHFKEFLNEAHARGIRVITELVINHTSDQHHWFQRAREAKKGSKWRDFYVWSDRPDRYSDARIIFTDFESSNWTWDPVANAYYWHRFYSHQPDLNYDSPHVQKAILEVVDFWFDLGVDGLRLDAVPYLYEREGTNCENLPETHAFLKKLRDHVDQKYRNRMLLAEANQWPEDSVEYFGDGDECHMAFNFPVMPRMFMAVQMEDQFPITDILDPPVEIPVTCQWAIFLRNHDELTLEMVTDEERDYMYRYYANDPRAKINAGIRRRLAPLLGNNRRRVELMNILLLSMPGTPVLYYGDEIGMGDNFYLGDRDGVRTPMQWSSDRNAGFSRANPHGLYLPVIIDPQYHFEAVNVEVQEGNVSSLLWWMRRVIAVRKQYRSLSRGDIRFLSPENHRVLAFVREYEDEQVLVVVNLSRFTQVVDLDVADWSGLVPEELFSQNEFPPFSDKPYTLTLGPYGHYWLKLNSRDSKTIADQDRTIPTVKFREDAVLTHDLIREQLEKISLRPFVSSARWFGGKGQTIRTIRIKDHIPIRMDNHAALILILEVDYKESDSEIYQVPVMAAFGETALVTEQDCPRALLARIEIGDRRGAIFDASCNEEFRSALLQIVRQRKTVSGSSGRLSGLRGRSFRRLSLAADNGFESRLLGAEQSNTSLLYGEAFILKMYRKLETGVNPDTELVRMLSEKVKFEHIPEYAGGLEYRAPQRQTMTLGILQRFIPNQGDGWNFALDQAQRYFERALAERAKLPDLREGGSTDTPPEEQPWWPKFEDMVGGFFSEMMFLLGRRTGEMHQALSSNLRDRDFAPEKFSTLYQRSIYQSIRSQVRQSIRLLEKHYRRLPKDDRETASHIISAYQRILRLANRIVGKKIDAMKIRIHGDYHLGQVLFTGKDFVIIDFEGEPARPISERRIKRSPLRDIAGMIRSFHYAAYTGLRKNPSIRSEDVAVLEPWAELWYDYISATYISGYREAGAEYNFLPPSEVDFGNLLQAFLLEKAAYEISYEINNRPDWVSIPLSGMKQLLDASATET